MNLYHATLKTTDIGSYRHCTYTPVSTTMHDGIRIYDAPPIAPAFTINASFGKSDYTVTYIANIYRTVGYIKIETHEIQHMTAIPENIRQDHMELAAHAMTTIQLLDSTGYRMYPMMLHKYRNRKRMSYVKLTATVSTSTAVNQKNSAYIFANTLDQREALSDFASALDITTPIHHQYLYAFKVIERYCVREGHVAIDRDRLQKLAQINKDRFKDATLPSSCKNMSSMILKYRDTCAHAVLGSTEKRKRSGITTISFDDINVLLTLLPGVIAIAQHLIDQRMPGEKRLFTFLREPAYSIYKMSMPSGEVHTMPSTLAPHRIDFAFPEEDESNRSL